MDRVRFGRALGVGAREAAKALAKAADAAAAPNPRRVGSASPRVEETGARVARQVEQVKVTSAGVRRGGKKFGEAMLAPITKAGAVLWLEVTGVLFAMVALAFGVWVWQQRAELRGTGTPMHKAWLGVVMLVVFGYFTVSSYTRAARRGRR